MKNERVDRTKFLDTLHQHYMNLYDMGQRRLLWPQFPSPIIFYCGKQVVTCDFSDEVILFGQCEYCDNTNLDGGNCCVACGAHVEM